MTRASIPRFDLYEELEVSRQASAEVIEAAYRALVKRHHPDVAGAADDDRIKRLNAARDWLVSPTRRARYDAATGGQSSPDGTQARTARPRTEPVSAGVARASSPSSFGINSAEVRQFLAELRELDAARAQRIVDAAAGLDPGAYADARSAALAMSRDGRTSEWLFARDAGSVIARGKLADSPLARVVSTIAADVAGAIVVRDLLPPAQLELLLEPWSRRDVEVGGAPVLQGARRPQRVANRGSIALAGGAFTLVLLVAVAGMSRPATNRDAAVAGITSAPSGQASQSMHPSSVASPPLVAVGEAETPAPTPFATATRKPSATRTQRPSNTPKPTVRPRATPVPTRTPRPTPVPTEPATPAPTPSPTTGPTATPLDICVVVDLVGVNTSNAQQAWNDGGFTGRVMFSPLAPPHYEIAWQSLAAGTDAPCTSDIAVQLGAP